MNLIKPNSQCCIDGNMKIEVVEKSIKKAKEMALNTALKAGSRIKTKKGK